MGAVSEFDNFLMIVYYPKLNPLSTLAEAGFLYAKINGCTNDHHNVNNHETAITYFCQDFQPSYGYVFS